MNKKIKSKVIDATFLLDGGKKELRRIVFICNSIDTLILNMQELFPNRGISRESVLNWKFMTVAEYEQMKKENNNTDQLIEMFNQG